MQLTSPCDYFVHFLRQNVRGPQPPLSDPLDCIQTGHFRGSQGTLERRQRWRVANVALRKSPDGPGKHRNEVDGRI